VYQNVRFLFNVAIECFFSMNKVDYYFTASRD